MDTLTLPDARWRSREGVARLADVLGAYDGLSRYVGGAVRDTLLALPVSDIDLATTLTPDAVIARLDAAGIRAVPTGIAHGTVTAILRSGPVEVTTLRRDVATDGRHATVAYSENWREDASRRDFTMNALYADPVTGAVFDYFGGADDMKAGIVRFIGDPYRRIAEDHLRILRFFRFHARFGETPEPAALAACTARARDLMALSRERIASEIRKLLVTRGAVRTVELMIDHDILLPVLPEIGVDGIARLAHVARREEAAQVAPDALRRLSALLPDDPDIAAGVAARLKLSNADRKRLAVAADPTLDAPRPLAYRIGIAGALDRFLLHAQSDDAAIDAAQCLRDWVPPRLPLTGGAIVARGIDKGPDVARLLRAVETLWIDEGFPDADRTRALLDQIIANRLRVARNA